MKRKNTIRFLVGLCLLIGFGIAGPVPADPPFKDGQKLGKQWRKSAERRLERELRDIRRSAAETIAEGARRAPVVVPRPAPAAPPPTTARAQPPAVRPVEVVRAPPPIPAPPATPVRAPGEPAERADDDPAFAAAVDALFAEALEGRGGASP